MNALAVRQLRVCRGEREVLRGIDLAAGGGEFIAVIGPNGSGKSTLLAALAGLVAPVAGEVRLDGEPLSRIGARRLAMRRAYLPQNARCEWALSVERMVALGLMAIPQSDASSGAAARIEAVLAECDLLPLRARPVTALSGGELARAMLARALVADPAVLIVDEPLAGLDPRHAWDAARRLRSLAVEQGRLVIAAMHDLNIALRRATRIWALKSGSVLADGPPVTTMNAAMLGALFDMPVAVRGEGADASVDFAP